MAEVSSSPKIESKSISETIEQPIDSEPVETTESTHLPADSKMVPSNPLPSFSNYLKQGFPLFLLLLINLIYSHTAYIALFIGLVVVFDWSNDIILRQAYLLNDRSISTLALLISFLLLNTVLIFPIIKTLWIFHLSDFANWWYFSTFFSSVLFDVVLMDFVLKFLTLSVKCCLIIPPNTVIPTQKRSGFFVFFEALSQLVRCFMPVLEWLKYIMNSPSCVTQVICWLVALLYCAVKIHAVKSKLSHLSCGWDSWRKPKVIGRSLVLDEEVSSLKPCPICFKKCQSPVALSCNHTFCYSCCQMWFSWDKHCPVCSSNAVYSLVLGVTRRMPSILQVTSKNCSWKRGNTDYMVQLF